MAEFQDEAGRPPCSQVGDGEEGMGCGGREFGRNQQ